ncbi:MAG: heme ABC exporter ATP-binding protein CcmA [Acidimicrobiia bacterium]
MSTPSLVVLDGVSVRAGSLQILRTVDLRVEPGEIVGVFGSNGAGKTTLLRLLATLIRPSAGSGSVLGAQLSSQERYDVRQNIGYVGHVPGLYGELTLSENLSFMARARGLDDAVVEKSLAAVGLEGASRRLADQCSHGMQRRAEFARVLMTRPDLLLLDEPHSALDADAIDLVDSLVQRTASQGGAAVLVSHDKERVLNVADRTFEVAGGNLV